MESEKKRAEAEHFRIVRDAAGEARHNAPAEKALPEATVSPPATESAEEEINLLGVRQARREVRLPEVRQAHREVSLHGVHQMEEQVSPLEAERPDGQDSPPATEQEEAGRFPETAAGVIPETATGVARTVRIPAIVF